MMMDGWMLADIDTYFVINLLPLQNTEGKTGSAEQKYYRREDRQHRKYYRREDRQHRKYHRREDRQHRKYHRREV